MVHCYFPCLLCLMFMTVSTAETACSKNLGDKSVLLCFKNGLENNGGSALSSWDLSRNISTWKGIQWSQDMANPRVLSINLSDAELPGSLWPFWCGLPMLKSLDLYWNNLTGSLNLDPGLCHNNNSMLHHLNLQYNFLSGHIPTTISTMHQLKYLNLGGNHFTGHIPTTISTMHQLRYLNLEGNNLTGPIPSSIGNCAQLEELALSGNSLSGEIPETISNCTRLRRIFLDENSLTGKLPSNIGNLSNLRVLILNRNKLKGDLPTSIGMLGRLKILDVGWNSISGSFPNSMAGMSALKILSVSENLMGGYIPEWIGNFSNLGQLSLGRNNFIGGIPVGLANLTFMKSRPNLDKVDPDTMDLGLQLLLPTVGASKSDLFYFYHVSPIMLDLTDNDLTGSIPPELGTLHSLQQLWLFGNRLSGSIPASLSYATDLILLQLDDNELSGEIPTELTRLSYLTFFNVSNNRLSGRIPSSGQFSTFDPSSFFGNADLCGFQLNKSCTISAAPPNSPLHEEEDDEEVLIGVPFAVGAAIGFAAAFLNIVFLLPQAAFDRMVNRVVNKWHTS